MRRRALAPAVVLCLLGVTELAPNERASGAGPPAIPSFKPLASFQTDARVGYDVAQVTRRVALRASPAGEVVARLKPSTEWGTPRILSIVEREGRWLGVSATERPNGRLGWIPASAVELGRVPDEIIADLSERTVRLYREGLLLETVRVAIGRPSNPTPPGRYAITDLLRVRDPASPYGCCAIALTGHQPNVPLYWPGGDRLAIHGTPSTESIGQAASLGCLRASNGDMQRLFDRGLYAGTPVFIKA